MQYKNIVLSFCIFIEIYTIMQSLILSCLYFTSINLYNIARLFGYGPLWTLRNVYTCSSILQLCTNSESSRQ